MPPLRNDMDIDSYSDADPHEVTTPMQPRHMLKDYQKYDSDVDSDFQDESDGGYSEYSGASMEEDDLEEEIHDPAVADAMFARITSQDSKKLFNGKARRIAIAYLFMNKYGGRKSYGVMAKIKRDIGMSDGTKIGKILDAVIHCKCIGVIYTGERYQSDKPGPKCKIAPDSEEGQIIADRIEEGNSIREAQFQAQHISEQRRQRDSDDISNPLIHQ